MASTWEEFFAKHPPPQDLTQTESLLKSFTDRHLKENNKVVLITVNIYYLTNKILQIYLYIVE